jgi:hypothetical protein
MRGDLTHPVGLLLIGSEGAAVIFSILGMVGVGLIRAGMRLKAGALLMLIGATGVAASTADYPLLLSVIMAPLVEATVDPVDYPDPGYDIASLAPPWRSSSARHWLFSPVADQEGSRPPAKLAHGPTHEGASQ